MPLALTLVVSVLYADGATVAVYANGDRWRLTRSGARARPLNRDAALAAIADIDDDANEGRASLVAIDDAALRAVGYRAK